MQEEKDENVQHMNETCVVHERKLRFQFYFGQMDERWERQENCQSIIFDKND